MISFTNCKINIGLDIVAKRPDGYHDIVTAMVPIPWHDVIEIVPTKQSDTELITVGRDVACSSEANLVMKAYRVMQQQYGLGPVKIVLQKNIPDGAGLGGGSGDAASTILALNEYFSLNLSNESMCELASQLGADCPFFIYDRPMLATGTGTTLSPIKLDLDGTCVLIAKPAGVNISTKQAYAGVTPHRPAIPLPELLQKPIDEWQGLVKNDFERSIFPISPQIAQAKQTMFDCGAAYASMTGSGAAVYGIFLDEKACLRASLPDCETFRCSFCHV